MKKYNSPNYIGKKFNHLTIISYSNGNFLCKCDCGELTEHRASRVARGETKTCGYNCKIHKKYLSEMKKKHGLSKTRLYNIWNNMISRCYHSNSINYENYGARGITVCDEWRHDFLAFAEWAKSNGYSNELTIDRIDNSKGYEPCNCRWASYSEQYKNMRTHKHKPRKSTKHIWEINGTTKSGVEWCKDFDLSFSTVIYRIKKYKITPYEALTMNKIQSGRPRKEG